MNDWNAFTQSVPWFANGASGAEVSESRNAYGLSSKNEKLFPKLAELLERATVTDVSLKNGRYHLLAWGSSDQRRMGWLCLLPSQETPNNLYSDHKLLLKDFGGIVERFDEPEHTWLLNLNEALTQKEASYDGSCVEAYQWAFDDAGLELPIQPKDYYSIAREANGNMTLCHRVNGHVLMFAPDHSFEHLTPLKGCPEYTLYEIEGAATFRDWVNAVARQWLAHLAADSGPS
jgi:hypothetical protein